jgi:hypothetical protein
VLSFRNGAKSTILFGLFEDGARDGEDNSRRRRRENRARQSSGGFDAASESGQGYEGREARNQGCNQGRN